MSDETKEDIPMAECGACRAIVPLNSDKCPECAISFSGVSDESLGECGACKGLVPLDSTKCPHCGTIFVADDVVEVLRKWLETTGITIPTLFQKFDTNGDNLIDSTELKTGLLSLNLADLPPSQVERLVNTIDEDGDGQIDLSELHETITGEKLPTPDSVTEKTPPIAEINEEGSETTEENEVTEELTSENSNEVDESDQIIEDDSDEVADDSDSEEQDSVVEEEEFSADEAFMQLGMAISEQGLTIREVFETMDTDSSGLIMGPELQKGIEEILGEHMDSSSVYSILQLLDQDDDGNVDPMELIEALEALDLGIDSDDASLSDIDDHIDDLESEVMGAETILHLISDAMDESGQSPNSFFNTLDKDGNGQVSVEEFTQSISELVGQEFSHKDIESFLATTDDDGDGSIDIIEFVGALESLDDAEDAVDEDSSLSKKVDKPFPTDMQRKMMGKQWNDIVWPLIHLLFGLFIAAWILNGLGGIGPLGVDGTGGNVALETPYKLGFEGLNEGDIYSCDPDVQVGECRNSLTPFSGESSSMPAGFYWDGIFMIVLGLIGLTGSLVMHLFVVSGWRARAKAMKEVSDDTDDARNESSNEDNEGEESENDDKEFDDEDEESDDEDEESDDEDEESEDEDEESDDEEEDEGSEGDSDDEIDIGSHIGLSFEDEEVYGTIIEFDDEEETVTIEEDGTGDLVTGYQEDMFLE